MTRSKVRRERMGHIDLAAPVSHIWFFKGVPSRIGYLIDMAPKELEKVLYFAASIVTWIDEEARTKDMNKLEKEVKKVLDGYTADREQRTQELNESLERRVAWIEGAGDQSKFDPEDELWAEGLGINPKKLDDAERTKLVKETKKLSTPRSPTPRPTSTTRSSAWTRSGRSSTEMKLKDVINDEAVFRELKDRFGSPFGWGEYFRGGMGAESIRDLLEQVDLEAECEELEQTINTSKGQKQARAVKRLKVASAFLNSANKPDWMVLDCVPVIPPELRPMVQLDGGRFATSDLNDLYRRVINRNNRLKRLLDLGAPEIIVNNEKRMLQEAVDALFDNGRRGRPVTGPGNRALKSLSDMLKGKQGRFRQNLLGKRVDYSGRSVIVSGPSLKLHQCGLPKLMALELFKPFIMARLVERKAVQNIKAAKKMVDSMIPEVWDVLEEVIHEHPVLLNRAPTLHRLGIQAFEPVLVEGKAIQVHPLVCHAFNADFDGDQMAVHVPLSAEAQAEARMLMLSSNNILSPAHGTPLATPSQDMVLGIYFLTYGPDAEELAAIDEKLKSGRRPNGSRPHAYRSAQEAELAYENGIVKLHDQAEYRRPGHEHFLTTVGRIIFNDRIERAIATALGDDWDPEKYEFVNRSLKKRDINEIVFRPGRGLRRPGDRAGARRVQGARLPLLDARPGSRSRRTTSSRRRTRRRSSTATRSRSSEIEAQYDDGLLSEEDRKEQLRVLWDRATDEVAQAMEDNLDELNPIFMMANSGARGSFKQIRQLAGMRGLMANPKGEIIERPIKANFMEGLSVLEYFISTHGARKGLADTALRTADSGYLTRRLVDVAPGRDHPRRGLQDQGLRRGHAARRRGRAEPEPGRPDRGEEVRDQARPRAAQARARRSTMPELELIAEAFGDEEVLVPVRSVLKCELETGVCQACYGRALATGSLVEIGDAVGIIAAQSIGEPGTQLTMRTFHTGGVAGLDITQGLPRVVELFEARKPKGMAEMAEVDGKVAIEETDKEIRVTITDAKGEEHAYKLPPRARLLVKHGDKVEAGTQLEEGSLYPADLLRIRGRTAIELYLVERGAEGLQGPGRRHQRQAHRADRASDAEAGPRSTPRARRRCCRVRSRTGTSSSSSTRRSRTRAARRPRARR